MVNRDELTRALDTLLDIHAIAADKSNNGLQVEGCETVETVVVGVDGCLALYEHAVALGAEFIFVHHGESWGPGWQYVTGRTAARLGTLMRSNISLYAAHLPLDVHPVHGHNACIARKLQLSALQPFADYGGFDVGMYGTLPLPQSVTDLATQLDSILDTQSMIYDFRQAEIRTVGIVSGAGFDAVAECQTLNIDCLITGECDHTDYHIMRELSAAVITCGHYRTEVPGVVSVMEYLHEQFALDCHFIDLPTGL